MAPPQKSKPKWSVISHIIWPLIWFGGGVMFAASMLGLHHVESVLEAPGSETRLVELMGTVNDLENTVSDLKRQISKAQDEKGRCEGSLHAKQRELGEVETKLAEAEAKVGSTGDTEAVGSMDKEIAEEEAWAASVAGSKGGSVKWSKLGNDWRTTELEPMSFSKVFDIGCVIDFK
jgi:hypothetical protein